MPCVSGKYAGGGGVVKKSPGSGTPWKNMSSTGEQPRSTRCRVFRDKMIALRWKSY